MNKLRAIESVADMGAVAAVAFVVLHDARPWLAGGLAFAAYLCGIVSGRLHEWRCRNVSVRRAAK